MTLSWKLDTLAKLSHPFRARASPSFVRDRPSDAAAAIKFFETLMDEHVARLEELLDLHEELAGDEAAELADRVSCNTSAAGERLRPEQTAKAARCGKRWSS
jgi:hypothetical protein